MNCDHTRKDLFLFMYKKRNPSTSFEVKKPLTKTFELCNLDNRFRFSDLENLLVPILKNIRQNSTLSVAILDLPF